MRRAVVIANPASRRGVQAERRLHRACAALGLPLEVQRTAGPGDATRLALRHAAARQEGDVLFALGGDGTLVDVVGAVAAAGIPVGILAAGTGNQVARFLGVPLDVRRAIRAYAAAPAVVRAIDLGALGPGRRFAITAGLGMDAEMILGAPARAKRRFGIAAYLYSAMRAVLRARTFPVRIEADGRVLEREAGVAMVANIGALLDGRVPLGPGIVADDGWLDVCVFSPRGMRDGVALVWRMLRRDYRDDPRMLFLRARSVRLEAPADVPAQADGELLPPGRIAADVVPLGARFLLPAR